MQNKSEALPTADEIAAMATRGENISSFFTNRFTVIRPIRRVSINLPPGMLRKLDSRAARLSVSRQAVIEMLLKHALDLDEPQP